MRASCSSTRAALSRALCPELHVLVVAAPAAARAGVRAGGFDPVGRGLHDEHGVGPQEGAARLGDAGPDTLAGQCVADEDHPAVGPVGDAAAARRHGADQEFQLVALRRFGDVGLAGAPHGERS